MGLVVLGLIRVRGRCPESEPPALREEGRASWARARPWVSPPVRVDKPCGVQSRPWLWAAGCNEVTDSTGFLVLPPKPGRLGSPGRDLSVP